MFLFLKTVIVSSITLSHTKASEVRTQQFESYRVYVNFNDAVSSMINRLVCKMHVVSCPLTLKPKNLKRNFFQPWMEHGRGGTRKSRGAAKYME